MKEFAILIVDINLFEIDRFLNFEDKLIGQAQLKLSRVMRRMACCQLLK